MKNDPQNKWEESTIEERVKDISEFVFLNIGSLPFFVSHDDVEQQIALNYLEAIHEKVLPKSISKDRHYILAQTRYWIRKNAQFYENRIDTSLESVVSVEYFKEYRSSIIRFYNALSTLIESIVYEIPASWISIYRMLHFDVSRYYEYSNLIKEVAFKMKATEKWIYDVDGAINRKLKLYIINNERTQEVIEFRLAANQLNRIGVDSVISGIFE